MSYYFEVWLRGYAKDHLRRLSARREGYHPHITLVRPFKPRVSDDELANRVMGFCAGRRPIPFLLAQEGSFPGNIRYLSVRSPALLAFNDELELLLEDIVEFKPKLNDAKILHATFHSDEQLPPQEPIEQYMLRLTGIKDGLIWRSYDFVTGEELDREQSLDKERWYRTVAQFTEQTGLKPTSQGFVRR